MIHSCHSNAFYCFYFTHLVCQLSPKMNDKHTKSENAQITATFEILSVMVNRDVRFVENHTRQALRIQFFKAYQLVSRLYTFPFNEHRPFLIFIAFFFFLFPPDTENVFFFIVVVVIVVGTFFDMQWMGSMSSFVAVIFVYIYHCISTYMFCFVNSSEA